MVWFTWQCDDAQCSKAWSLCPDTYENASEFGTVVRNNIFLLSFALSLDDNMKSLLTRAAWAPSNLEARTHGREYDATMDQGLSYGSRIRLWPLSPF
jgi:hypothetical protein